MHYIMEVCWMPGGWNWLRNVYNSSFEPAGTATGVLVIREHGDAGP
jgi:hypothetical protein